jgi:hypothetical protein
MSLDSASRALLLCEWTSVACVLCGSERPGHAPNCVMDLALGERGFATQHDRDAARVRIRFSGKIKCVHCGSEGLRSETKALFWTCADCGKTTPRSPTR